MSRIKNKFSLFDFCKKQAGKMEIYGEETLDDEGNIIPFIDQAALITHYLQLDRKGVNLPYRDKAENILKLWKGQGDRYMNPPQSKHGEKALGINESCACPLTLLCISKNVFYKRKGKECK